MINDLDVLFSRFEVALGDLRAPMESKALHASVVVDPTDVPEVEMVDGTSARTTEKPPKRKKQATSSNKGIDSFFKNARVSHE